MTRTPDHVAWGLALLALGLRAGWVAYRWTGHGAAFEYPDEELHWQLAAHLVHDGSLVTEDGRFAARMPLYPLFLAPCAVLGSVGVLLARLAQAVVGAATVIVAHRLARAAAGPRAALIGGLLVACDPFGIFFGNLLLTETLFTFLGVALTACAWAVMTRSPGNWRAWSGVAAIGAAAILTRPSAAGWLPLLWLLILALGRDRRRIGPRLVACPVVLALLLLPWGLRNQAVLRDYAWLSTNGGVTLYDAQGPQADGSSNQAFLLQMAELHGLGEVERDRLLKRLAVQQMRSDPGRVLRLAGVKFLRTWSPLPNVTEYRTGPAAVAGAAYTVLLLAGTVAAVVRAWGDRRQASAADRRRLLALVALPLLYFTVVHCVYIGSVRYRVPLMPLMALVAAVEMGRLRSDAAGGGLSSA